MVVLLYRYIPDALTAIISELLVAPLTVTYIRLTVTYIRLAVTYICLTATYIRLTATHIPQLSVKIFA